MRKFYISILFACISFYGFSQTIITKWDFDNLSPTAAMLPTTGTGTFSLIGGVEPNADVATGLMPGGNPSTGKAYSIKTFPEGSGSRTAGFQFKVSTVGFTDAINVTFDPRGSNTSSKWQQYEYTTDGTTWTVLSNNAGALTNAFTASPMVSLTLPAICSNQANFGFRIVSIFAPTTSAYAAVGAASTYAAAGTWRIDNVTFSSGTLGLKQNAIAGLTLYPNPVINGNLFITSNSSAVKTAAVYDILGKQVLVAKTTNNAINVSSLKGGTYIVKITEDGKSDTRKLMIR
jgi:hypothetical protein